MARTIYLDHAAATPLDPDVLKAMMPFFKDKYFNPSATYQPALAVRNELNSARANIAHYLGAKPQEIIFTAGATEANNLAITGLMSQYTDGNLVISAIEHESVQEPAKLYNVRTVKVKPDGQLDLAELEQTIDQDTVLVSIMLANNEIGAV